MHPHEFREPPVEGVFWWECSPPSLGMTVSSLRSLLHLLSLNQLARRTV